MIMLCFKNGSLSREQVRDQALGGNSGSGNSGAQKKVSWTEFDASLARTPPANDGHVFFACVETEIVPHTRTSGYFHFGPSAGDASDQQPPPLLRTAASGPDNAASQLGDRAVRGVLESQFLNMRLQCARLGLAVPKKIIVTGGATQNRAVLQVLADVMGADVEARTLVDSDSASASASGSSNGSSSGILPGQIISDTASLGAALRALHATTQRDSYAASALAAASPPSLSEQPARVEGASPPPPTSPLSVGFTAHAKALARTKLVSARADVHARYTTMLPRFEKLQQVAVQLLNQL
jgi:hypothetical protein